MIQEMLALAMSHDTAITRKFFSTYEICSIYYY